MIEIYIMGFNGILLIFLGFIYLFSKTSNREDLMMGLLVAMASIYAYQYNPLVAYIIMLILFTLANLMIYVGEIRYKNLKKMCQVASPEFSEKYAHLSKILNG